jgi:hypothetical protein
MEARLQESFVLNLHVLVADGAYQHGYEFAMRADVQSSGIPVTIRVCEIPNLA